MWTRGRTLPTTTTTARLSWCLSTASCSTRRPAAAPAEPAEPVVQTAAAGAEELATQDPRAAWAVPVVRTRRQERAQAAAAPAARRAERQASKAAAAEAALPAA